MNDAHGNVRVWNVWQIYKKPFLFTTCDVGVVVNFSFIFESTILTAYTTVYKLKQREHVVNLMHNDTQGPLLRIIGIMAYIFT